MQKTWADGPLVETDLYSHAVSVRNISDPDTFCNPQWPQDLHDPKLLPDMHKATELIWKVITSGKRIGIVGDYDMDGTPAAALLRHYFHELSLDPVVILPTREEGYGFAKAFVDRMKAQDVALIVTVDCGIRDLETADYALTQGIDVIITDHHECGEVLPQACAVINPKRLDSQYPFRELCGTGVAFKLVQALIESAPEAYQKKIPEAWLAWSLDLVALATVSDMVPLVDENRLLVTYGMKVLKKTRRLGLQRFFDAAGLEAAALGYSDIAFKITPKFNASGRMANMEDVLLLLSSQDRNEVDAAVTRVLARSAQSQMLMAEMLEQAKERAQAVSSNAIILVADDAWHPGLTGLVASRLVEEYKRPVGVFAGVDDTTYRGSMRSIPGVSLPHVLTQASSLLEKFGGHEQAAGLSFPKANFASLSSLLGSVSLIANDDAPVAVTDGTISADHVSLSQLDQLERLAPWGMEHPEPTWSFTGVTLDDVKWLSDGQHLRAVIRGLKSDLPVIFFRAEAVKPFVNQVLDLYGTLTINEFRGKRTPQLMIKGIALHG